MSSNATEKRPWEMSKDPGPNEYPPFTIYRRITPQNSRLAKIIKKECRRSGMLVAETAKLGVDATVPDDANVGNHPSDYLSSNCLGSPRKVWDEICNCERGIYERDIESYKKNHTDWIHDRIDVLQHMMELCQRLKFRRETYYRAMDMFDRYMVYSNSVFDELKQVCYIGSVIVYMAAKIEEDRYHEWTKFRTSLKKAGLSLLAELYPYSEIECGVVKSLDWSFMGITPFDWGKIYMHMMRTHFTVHRVKNSQLALATTPKKKRERHRKIQAKDIELSDLSWGQLDNLVIGEPSTMEDFEERTAMAQILDLCTADLYSFNFTYRQLGAAASLWIARIDEEMATRITGLEMKELRPALDFIYSYGVIYTKYVRKNRSFTLAPFSDNNPLCSDDESDENESEDSKMEQKKDAARPPPVPAPATKNVQPKRAEGAQMSQTVRLGKRRAAFETKQEEPKAKVATPKLRKKIFVTDLEVSLVEVDVNSPDFLNISMDANIPKQERLSILSPKSEKQDTQPCPSANTQNEAAPTKTEPTEKISVAAARAPTSGAEKAPAEVHQAALGQTETGTAKAASKPTRTVEMICNCGCGKLVTIDDPAQVNKMRAELSVRMQTGQPSGKMVVKVQPPGDPQKEETEEIPKKKKTWPKYKGDVMEQVEVDILHPVELQEQRMNKFYTQSFPLPALSMKPIVQRLQGFWLARENREVGKRRRSHSPWQRKRHEEDGDRRRNSWAC